MFSANTYFYLRPFDLVWTRLHSTVTEDCLISLAEDDRSWCVSEQIIIIEAGK